MPVLPSYRANQLTGFYMRGTVAFNGLNFCPDFCTNAGTWLDKKAKFNFKIYDVTDWIIINATVIKSNQAMKLCQLTECHVRKNFHEKPCAKYIILL